MTIEYPKIERPTEPGWYWFKSMFRPYWASLRVYKDGWGDLWVQQDSTQTLLLEWPHGEWRGPIPEPTP